ncbi:MAG: ThuA domain-containing protein [Propionibacteriaceae bacterium]|jgi:type 1 glutamine amidotransferase|nr:ThuA domain-containing protein [Propionibacteriaceae bacterium]
MHLLILTGHGRYEDQWHDVAATSHRTALVAAEMGHTAEDRSTMPRYIDDFGAADLIVVNAGKGRIDPTFDGDDAFWEPMWSLFDAHLDAGKPILALHASGNTFHGYPRWASVVGGCWVDGTSGHPEIGEETLTVDEKAHPIAAGLGDITVFDEKYSFLVMQPGSDAAPEDGGVVPYLSWTGTWSPKGEIEPTTHQLAWARTLDTGSRVVFDALGHCPRSFDSPSRVELLKREIAWCLGAL